MARLFDDGYTISEYRAHLGRLLGLFEPLERAAAQAADPAVPADALQRSNALREDLRAMGVTAEAIEGLERCHQIPLIEPAGIWGYAYVILGSMQGGKIIVRRLRAVLGPDASYGFYGAGNGRPEALWAGFCSDLEEHGKNDVETICATAVKIFDVYDAWLAEPLQRAGPRQ